MGCEEGHHIQLPERRTGRSGEGGRPMRIEKIGNCELWLGNCNELLLNTASIDYDAVVTSPPCGELRDYNGKVDDYNWHETISRLKVKEGGIVMWNVRDQVIDGSESGASFKQALYFIKQGYRLHDTMIYLNASVSFPCENSYHSGFEYMFVFSKGKPKTFNPIKDR